MNLLVLTGGLFLGIIAHLIPSDSLQVSLLDVARWWQGIPTALRVVLISMIPVVELRGAIPVAMASWEMSWDHAYFWAVMGNMIPVPFILLFLDPVSSWLMKRSRLMDKFFTWLFRRTRRKHTKAFERWRDLALCLFVAVPLPGTGAWTGALAAFLFGVPLHRALISIFLGVLVAGAIVTSVTHFFQQLPGWLTVISAGIIFGVILVVWLRGKRDTEPPTRQKVRDTPQSPVTDDSTTIP